MKVAFRADASIRIGTGHVMRCLTLANALRDRGTRCVFVCREHPGHLASKIRASGHLVHLLPVESDFAPVPGGPHGEWLGSSEEKDASDTTGALSGDVFDWMVVDHYAIGVRWETLLRPHVGRMMVIDDLADRAHDCDLLLDANFGREDSSYDGLVPETSKRLVGSRYVLLRPEFTTLRDHSLERRRNRPLRRILISLGGVDADNVTGRILDMLARTEMPADVEVEVILGRDAPAADVIRKQSSGLPFNCQVRVGIDDMAQAMADSDLAIGSGGTSIYERLYMGLPSLVTPIAENQRAHLEVMAKAGLVRAFADPDELPLMLGAILEHGPETPPNVVGSGIQPVLRELLAHDVWLSPPSALDVRRTFHWLADPLLRHDFMLRAKPERPGHFRYWQSLLADESQRVFALREGTRHVGNAGIRRMDGAGGELWLYLGEDVDRGRGVGRRALDAIEEYMRTVLGLRLSFLHVAESNEVARRLYRRAGYIETGRASQDHGFAVGAIRMEKVL